METKDYVTVTLSVLAFVLGVFNLWWGSFRRRIALFYVQSDGWRYVLVNGGKTDVLVTEVKYWFSGVFVNEGSAPPQKTDTATGMPVLLKAGTALEHPVIFLNGELTFEYLFREGRPSPEREDYRALTVWAKIEWVDNNGEYRRGEVDVAEIWVNKNSVRAWFPLTRRADLTDAVRYQSQHSLKHTSRWRIWWMRFTAKSLQ